MAVSTIILSRDPIAEHPHIHGRGKRHGGDACKPRMVPIYRGRDLATDKAIRNAVRYARRCRERAAQSEPGIVAKVARWASRFWSDAQMAMAEREHRERTDRMTALKAAREA